MPSSKAKGRRRYTVKDYFAEKFLCGGLVMTREQVIRELQRMGGTPGEIAMYLFGLESSQRSQEDL